jgi:hypothetical protein
MPVPQSINARTFHRVSEQRFLDAQFLLDVNRTTSAVYLAGYSIECIIKALILSNVPNSREDEVLKTFRGGRAHEFGWLKNLYIKCGGAAFPRTIVPHFVRVGTWSTDMRYFAGSVKCEEAKLFLESASNILEWAKGCLLYTSPSPRDRG